MQSSEYVQIYSIVTRIRQLLLACTIVAGCPWPAVKTLTVAHTLSSALLVCRENRKRESKKTHVLRWIA